MSYEHFARQEEEISNTYMSANGDMETPKKGKVNNNSLKFGEISVFNWNECPDCYGGFYDTCELKCKGKKLLIWGVMAYIVYRIIKKKK